MCNIDWGRVQGFLEILLSWPPVALLVFGVLYTRFGKQIHNRIAHIQEAKWGDKSLIFAHDQLSQLPLAPVSLDAVLPGAVDDPVAGEAMDAPGAEVPVQLPESNAVLKEPPLVSDMGPRENAEYAELQRELDETRAVLLAQSNATTELRKIVSELKEHVAFEQVYGVIYGSQFEALQAMQRAGSDGLSDADMLDFLLQHRKRGQPAGVNAFESLDQFGEFFLVSKLAGLELRPALGGLRYMLRSEGHRFLKYIATTRTPKRPW